MSLQSKIVKAQIAALKIILGDPLLKDEYIYGVLYLNGLIYIDDVFFSEYAATTSNPAQQP